MPFILTGGGGEEGEVLVYLAGCVHLARGRWSLMPSVWEGLGELLEQSVPPELGFECLTPFVWLGPLQQPRKEYVCEVVGAVGDDLKSQPARCFLCLSERWELR